VIDLIKRLFTFCFVRVSVTKPEFSSIEYLDLPQGTDHCSVMLYVNGMLQMSDHDYDIARTANKILLNSPVYVGDIYTLSCMVDERPFQKTGIL
jgi:hypothetical protein